MAKVDDDDNDDDDDDVYIEADQNQYILRPKYGTLSEGGGFRKRKSSIYLPRQYSKCETYRTFKIREHCANLS
jgi:hypothetical protein